MSNLQLNMTSPHANTDGVEGRTYEEPNCVTASLLSVTRAGGATPNDLLHLLRGDRGQTLGGRFPLLRHGERDEIAWDVRRAVHRRDNFTCRICFMRYGDGIRLELDHVVPWSARGSDGSANLRTLCERCNQHRSNYHHGVDGRANLPVTWWCLDCHNVDPDRRTWFGRPEGVRTAPDHMDGGGPLTFAYCARCDINSYTEVVL